MHVFDPFYPSILPKPWRQDPKWQVILEELKPLLLLPWVWLTPYEIWEGNLTITPRIIHHKSLRIGGMLTTFCIYSWDLNQGGELIFTGLEIILSSSGRARWRKVIRHLWIAKSLRDYCGCWLQWEFWKQKSTFNCFVRSSRQGLRVWLVGGGWRGCNDFYSLELFREYYWGKRIKWVYSKPDFGSRWYSQDYFLMRWASSVVNSDALTEFSISTDMQI